MVAAEQKIQQPFTMKKLFAVENLLNLLLVFVPIAVILEYFVHPDPVWIFIVSCIAIVPLAGWMGKATEHIADKAGEGLGGFLNATFGNAAELIIALMALRLGHHDLVKASITGSIIGNILLVFGLSLLLGGLKHASQRYNRTAASLGATMLALSMIALVVPAVFHAVARGDVRAAERELSFEISIVLMITYVLSLVFSLKTHRHLYVGAMGQAEEKVLGTHGWPLGTSAAVLLVSTALVAWMSEFLVGAVDAAAGSLGMSQVFVGVILVAIIGNAAEHSTAILMAMKNKMDLAINIAVGSSIQIALFVAPLLVFCSYFVGPSPMDLLFTTFEVLAIAGSVAIIALIAHDGESNWMEGVQLLAVYVILGIAFYFLPVQQIR
jgi:Ca2+:H+ antiporter